MILPGSKQPYVMNILPRNVDRPLVWTVVKILGQFGERPGEARDRQKTSSKLKQIIY